VTGRPRSDPTEVTLAFGRHVRETRTALGWTLEELSARTGMGLGSLSRIENGFNLTLATAGRLAVALGVPLAALLRLASVACGHCQDAPPRGFTCQECDLAGPAVTRG
jgi:transcriptional regulator with XRE-family HTH domain